MRLAAWWWLYPSIVFARCRCGCCCCCFFFYLFRSSLKIIILSFAQFRFEKVHRISGNSSSRSTKNVRRSSQTTTTSCLFFILLHSFGFLFFLFCQALLLRDDDDDDDSVTTCARQRMFLLNFSSSFLPFCVPILYFHAYARSGEEYVILFCTRCRFSERTTLQMNFRS